MSAIAGSVFPAGDAAPVLLIFLNVNLPQTRKSRITNALNKIVAANDRSASRKAAVAVREYADHQQAANPPAGDGVR
eukprot:6384430-Lingulodinium_polyedra.AAC.1